VRALAVDPGFGFFGMSPFMWLGLLAIPFLLMSPGGPSPHRAAIRVATLIWGLSGVTLFLVNAGIIEWRAGWTVGPRYLAACPPFFAFGGLCLLERLSGPSLGRRAMCRGIGGGLALAGVLAIGTVGLLIDTLPETIGRPFAQFSIPLVWAGYVPHHVAEWFGWTSITFWYIACAALIAAPALAGLWPTADRRALYGARVLCFVFALVVGMVPAFTKPEPTAKLFVLSPDTRGIATVWEPPGRDRISTLRVEAERYGARRPCYWYHLAVLDRVLGNESQALRDEAHAGTTPKDACPRVMF
jgi:hypothetical protein